jgi:hypothetical protein
MTGLFGVSQSGKSDFHIQMASEERIIVTRNSSSGIH